MEYRTSLNIPENFPFGIEIEISNKSLHDIDILCKEHQKMIPSPSNWDTLKEETGEEYANLVSYKNLFFIKNNPKNYWSYFFEDTNDENHNLGIEVTSPILYNHTKDWKHIDIVLEALQDIDATVNEKCAAHIHIGAFPFQKDYKKLFHFFLFYLLYEPVFYKFSAMGNFGHIREQVKKSANPIVPQITDLKINQNTLEEYIKRNQSPSKKENALHFKGFKLNNYQYGSSFEFRMFNGTLDKYIWQNYINLVLSSLNYSISDQFNEQEIINKIKRDFHIRKNWTSIEEQIEYADILVEELVDTIFHTSMDKDLFYEQYSGKYLEKQKEL